MELYDEGRIDSGKTSSGRNPDFNLYLYTCIFIHRCIKKFDILASQVRYYCILYLLSFIVTMYWTKFLFSNKKNHRSQSSCINIILRVSFFLFFVSMLSKLFILCYIK